MRQNVIYEMYCFYWLVARLEAWLAELASFCELTCSMHELLSHRRWKSQKESAAFSALGMSLRHGPRLSISVVYARR
jgi:hypothetical protein